MKTQHKVGLFILAGLGAIALLGLLIHGSNVAVLNPQGSIAAAQRDLMVIVTLMMLIIVIPVFVMTFYFAFAYRATNKGAEYKPTWDHSRLAETLWWGIPFLLIAVLSVIIWISSHQLDPYKPLQSDKKPVTVQVVALQWKWLFIYPEQNVATVNRLYLPEGTPINFEITADAPMNSFWIPQLGGQVYAMTGMTTKLHLMANNRGSFEGLSANLSGEGFADMKFMTHVVSESEFTDWVERAKGEPRSLSSSEYASLSKPAVAKEPITYSSSEAGLRDTIIHKYKAPKEHTNEQKDHVTIDQKKSSSDSAHAH
ncbi:ubiquinol oxidase subunit II [Candidatus Saccharibacteria bacterium]|nr:MAG: ubiquinol oxidase subunit II [Candidatus Saccharibacteria bacterium]